MEIVKSKYVVNYVGGPVLIIIDADTLEEAMDKFDKLHMIDFDKNEVIKSDNKFIEFCLVSEVE